MSQQRHNIFMASVTLAVTTNRVQQFLLSAEAGKRAVIWESLIVARFVPKLARKRKALQLLG